MVFAYTTAFVTLAATNLDELISFYTHLLERSPQPYLPNVYAEFQLSGLRLAIFKPQLNHAAEFAQSANSGLSLCLEVKDLEQAIAHLTNLGYPPPGNIITAAHGREIYAYDPNGNRLILHTAKSS